MPPTLSAVSLNFVKGGAALLLALSYCPNLMARQDESTSASSAPVPGPPAPEQHTEFTAAEKAHEPIASPVVRITSVGRALGPASLERMLGPALKSSFDLRFSSSQHFQVEDLFRIRTDSLERIHVWVVTEEPSKARIYFANHDGTRYLMRDLERSNPINEMDREAIAQAIEWSLQAISEGTAGMTREEAKELLSEPAKEESSSPPAEPIPPAAEKIWRRKTTGWLPEVALLHDWTPVSGEMLGAQGPALRVGADKLSQRGQLGLSVNVHYQSPQRHAEDGVALELQSVGVRMDVRYLATSLIEGSGIGFRLGLGLDAVFSSPEALDWTRFEAEESTSYFVPFLAAGFVWQFHVEPSVRFETSLGVQVDIADFQYDVVTADGTQTLVSPWPVRPSLGLGVALF